MSALVAGFETGAEDVPGGIAQAIETAGYAVVDGALPVELLDALFVKFTSLEHGELTHAAIGRDGVHQVNRFVRTDETRWLDGEDPADHGFLDWMENLRREINRRLYLGLFDYEAHFARYAPGAYYKRHLDAFDGPQRNRVLSTVLYLNPAWQPANGGEMVLYAPGETGEALEVVQPLYGRLAVFLSERFPHEVLTTAATRYSIAGWFRVNGSIAGTLDPPR